VDVLGGLNVAEELIVPEGHLGGEQLGVVVEEEGRGAVVEGDGDRAEGAVGGELRVDAAEEAGKVRSESGESGKNIKKL